VLSPLSNPWIAWLLIPESKIPVLNIDDFDTEVIYFLITGPKYNGSDIYCAPEQSLRINLIFQIQNSKPDLGNRIRSGKVYFVIFLCVEIGIIEGDYAEM